MWLPAGNVLNSGTGFLNPVEETTLTIPSTATKVITVGAYDARFDQAAAFSGRGYTRATNQVKPDLVAPGVEIIHLERYLLWQIMQIIVMFLKTLQRTLDTSETKKYCCFKRSSFPFT